MKIVIYVGKQICPRCKKLTEIEGLCGKCLQEIIEENMLSGWKAIEGVKDD